MIQLSICSSVSTANSVIVQYVVCRYLTVMLVLDRYYKLLCTVCGQSIQVIM